MALYRPCHDAFCRYCHGLSGDREDARDLVGDTVLVALENFEKLRKKESFKAWLFGIARRLMLHKYRRSKFILSILSSLNVMNYSFIILF